MIALINYENYFAHGLFTNLNHKFRRNYLVALKFGDTLIEDLREIKALAFNHF